MTTTTTAALTKITTHALLMHVNWQDHYRRTILQQIQKVYVKVNLFTDLLVIYEPQTISKQPTSSGISPDSHFQRCTPKLSSSKSDCVSNPLKSIDVDLAGLKPLRCSYFAAS